NCGSAAPVKPIVPCDRPVLLFGSATLAAVGVAEVGRNDFASRLEAFFEGVCRKPVRFQTISDDDATLLGAADRIAALVASSPRSIALVHFPVSDIMDEAPVVQIVKAQRGILDACAKSGSMCVVGGQQPVNSLSRELADRQLELERAASA